MKTCASPNPWPIEDSLVFKTWHGRISTASRMDSPQVPRQLLRVGNPNDSDCFLVIKTIRYGRTWSVRGIPGAVIERGAHGATTGHLHVPIWISSSNPVPCVLEPPAAIFSALVGKPCDFVASPHPVTPHAGLSGSLAGAPVIKLNEIGQVFATPSARSHSSFASTIDAVQVANLENSLLRVVRYFPYSQGEGMKVKSKCPSRNKPPLGT